MEATQVVHPPPSDGASSEGEVFDPAPHRPNRRSLRAAALMTGAVFVALLAVGIVPRIFHHAAMQADIRRAATDLPKVQVAKVERSIAGSTLVLPASIQPLQETAIYARANGYVKRWNFDIGAHVRKGQLMAVKPSPSANSWSP